MFSRISNILITCIMLIAFGGVLQATAAETEANKAILRRIIEEVWNQGNLDLIDELYAADYVLHDPTIPGIRGSEGYKQFGAMYQTAFPDLHFTIEDEIAEGDKVVTRWTAIGTHKGVLMDIPPTLKQMTVTGISINRIANGKIVEAWNSQDTLGMMQQLGVIPPDREDFTWGESMEVTSAPGDPEENKAIHRRAFEEVWNQGNLAVVDEIFAIDYIFHNPVNPGIRGPEDYKQFVTIYRTAFPDITFTVEAQIAEGDKVVTRWTSHGTHQGELMGIPPTGKQMTVTGISILRIADGKIVDDWVSWDTLGMMRQLGVIPTPGQPEATLTHHLQAIGEGDMDAIMADYAEDAVLFTPNGALHGHDEIKPLFEAMVAGVLPPGSTFEMSQQIIEGEIAYIVWSAESANYDIPFGTDTFVIRDGKITAQTFAALMLSKVGEEIPPPTPLELPESAEKDVLLHHLQAVGEGDIDAIMSDYAENAVLFTPTGVLRGHDEIRPLFETIVTDILPPGSTFEMLQQIIEGEIAYIVWSAESANYKMPLGTDTFIIRDGKIQTQTFAAQMEVKPVLPEKVPAGHHKVEMYYEFVQDYASVPEERPDGLYLVSTREALLKGRSVTLTFDDGAVVELTGMMRGQHQELKVIFDEKGVPVKGVGPSYGTAELFDKHGNTLFRGTYTSEDEVLFSPDFEAVGFFSKTEAITLGEGPYTGYFCLGHIEASLGPDPENPGEFIVHGVGEAMLEKVSSAITEVPEEDYTRVFFASLSSGLNMISLPLKPVTSYTARSFAEYLGSTVVIKLDEGRQRFVGFTIDDLDDGFPIEGGKGYIVNVEESKVVSFVGAAWTNQPPVSASPPVAASDATWAFVLSGYLQSESWDGYAVKVRNPRTGATAIDTVVDGHFAAVWADLSRNSVVQEGDKLEVTLLSPKGEAIAKPIIHVRANDIRRAFAKIALEPSHFIPRSFALLQNYPNPFNPETWIPYKLAEDANVRIFIYNSAGQLMRVLSIGKMQAGSYLTKARAAYWDGRNERGENMGSGVYFYHLRAGDFQATRRMLVVK